MDRKRALKRLVRTAVVVAVTVGAIVFVRRLDLRRALEVLEGASPLWVVVAMLVNGTFRIGTRVLRTQTLLAALPGKVSLRDLAGIIYGSVALGYVVSPIAGSAARVYALQQRGVPIESVVAEQLWEKVVAGCALTAFAGPMLLRDTPPTAHYALLVAAIIGSIGVVLAIVVVAGFRRFSPDVTIPSGSRVRRWLFDLLHSLSRLHDIRILARALIWSLLSELSDVAMLALALHALGQPIDPAACVLGYIAVNVGSAVPSTPGQIGVFEATAAWALTAMNVPAEAALACGMLYHLIHIVPVLVVGLPALVRLRASRPADGGA